MARVLRLATWSGGISGSRRRSRLFWGLCSALRQLRLGGMADVATNRLDSAIPIRGRKPALTTGNALQYSRPGGSFSSAEDEELMLLRLCSVNERAKKEF
jgi:hypothetical protein